MTIDIDNLTYTNLQTECARLGLGGKGTKAKYKPENFSIIVKNTIQKWAKKLEQ